MSEPFVLIQLSDLHLGGTWGGDADPRERLTDTVRWIGAHGPRPDAVVVTGDLADHAADEEYTLVRELLEPLAAPLYVLPGNHDDRAALRRHFAAPGAGAEPLHAVFELGPLRLVVVDSVRPGEDAGALDGDRLAWIEAALAEGRDRPTVLALHHPPLLTGFAAWDQMLFPEPDREALAAAVAVNPQVLRIVAGHVHRPLAGTLGGRSVLAAPATYVQTDLGTDLSLALTSERPGYVLHTLRGGELISSVQFVS
ncbi:MAG TPA: phosphodiesterase [Gaiellaceae bacterium]|nr:phosphodiesterase [Gaiellaceae bacterium]